MLGDGQKSRLVWRAGRQNPGGGHRVESFLKHYCCHGWTVNHLLSLYLFVQDSDPFLLSLPGSRSCLLATGRQGTAKLLSSGEKVIPPRKINRGLLGKGELMLDSSKTASA